MNYSENIFTGRGPIERDPRLIPLLARRSARILAEKERRGGGTGRRNKLARELETTHTRAAPPRRVEQSREKRAVNHYEIIFVHKVESIWVSLSGRHGGYSAVEESTRGPVVSATESPCGRSTLSRETND